MKPIHYLLAAGMAALLLAGGSTKAPAAEPDKAASVALGFAGFEAYHEHCGGNLSETELSTMTQAEPSEEEMKPARDMIAMTLKVLGNDRFCREIKPTVDIALIKVRKAIAIMKLRGEL